MTPHTSVLEHRGIKLILTWKLHPYRIAFIVLEAAVHAPRGENYHCSYCVCMVAMGDTHRNMYTNNSKGK